MKTVSLKMLAEMNSELENLARRTGRSRSLIVCMALAAFLLSQRPKGSFLARAADLAGCVEGPPGLSRIKRRLRGYGG